MRSRAERGLPGKQNILEPYEQVLRNEAEEDGRSAFQNSGKSMFHDSGTKAIRRGEVEM